MSGYAVLISSAGRRVALLRCFRDAVQRCVGPTGKILASDMSELSAASREADEHFVTPHCLSDQFIPEMLAICSKHDVRLVVPTIDTELAVLANHAPEFAAIGTRVLVPGAKLVEISNDKARTHHFMEQHRIPCLRQVSANEPLPSDIGQWRAPLMAKPRSGSASVGVHELSKIEEISELPKDYVVEEHAAGDEYTMDVFVDQSGQVRAVVPRRRLETRAGEVSKGQTVRSGRLESAVRGLCELLPDARGVLTVQAFLDEEEGRVSIIEINARFGGGYPLTYEAGANFPLWLVQESLGVTPDFEGLSWTGDLVMLRYDDAIYTSAASVGLSSAR